MTDEVMNFDLDELAAIDQAELVIKRRDGTPTPWVWIIAGPGHPNTIALKARVEREMHTRARAQEVARVNGKKWKGDDETAADVKRRSAGYIADRVLGWKPEAPTLNGEPFPFSRENVIKILTDPERGDTIINQVNEFFDDERSFMKPSGTI